MEIIKLQLLNSFTPYFRCYKLLSLQDFKANRQDMASKTEGRLDKCCSEAKIIVELFSGRAFQTVNINFRTSTSKWCTRNRSWKVGGGRHRSLQPSQTPLPTTRKMPLWLKYQMLHSSFVMCSTGTCSSWSKQSHPLVINVSVMYTKAGGISNM